MRGHYTESGLYVPPFPQLRPKPYGRRDRSIMSFIGAVVNPDGTIDEQPEEWLHNAVHDAGEQLVGQVFLQEQSHSTKFLALLNDGSLAETDGTMSAVTESKTPGSDNYNRQSITSGNWTNDGLQGGDYRFSAAEKTFGPISGSSLTATHSALCTTSTGAGILISTVALAATTTIAVGQSFKGIPRWTFQ
jgi:hypothetical protein